ncbi:MAG: hypothetical protein HY727_00295 [Candidatus Rokubacteria bacterium]|nr:hypothetical protein [Candidatus Rokubacteria bacterium]
MSRRRNYGFERRRKEDLRRAKHEAKRQRRTERTEAGEVGPEMGEPQNVGSDPGLWEWFSPSRNRTIASPSGIHLQTEPPDDWILLTDGAEDPGPAA